KYQMDWITCSQAPVTFFRGEHRSKCNNFINRGLLEN
ncbi:UNVERIFIED_CONTAM: hypothetical protein ABIC26_005226, partial [Paenibacillus sp. PvR008]